MKWFMLILLALTVGAFFWAGKIFIAAPSTGEQLGALIQFAAGCVLGLVFFVLLNAKAIFR